MNAEEEESSSISQIQRAIWHNDMDKVDVLLAAGVKPDSPSMISAVISKQPGMLTKLLASGGDPNADVPDAFGLGERRTPLHLAIFSSDFAVEKVTALLEAGANPDDFAVLNATKSASAEILAKLLSAGGDPNAELDEELALDVAIEANDLMKVTLLADAGAKPNSYSMVNAADFAQPEILVQLLSAGGDPNARGNDGNSPLHYAAQAGYFEVVEALLTAGADPNHANECGQTPLHSVCSFGATYGSRDIYVRDIETSKLGETARLLLEAGSDPNARDKWGRTPLFNAAAAAHEDGEFIQPSIELVGNLVEKGADILAKDNAGKTASARAFHEEVHTFLVIAEAQARQQRLEAKIQEVGELAPAKLQSSDGPCLIVGGDLFNPREVAKAPAPTALQEAPLQRMRL
ncbi:TPA: ankyrin repeat domain-containing protein [Stenotrophomonas maltophilia]